MDSINHDGQLAIAKGGSVEITNDLWRFFEECLENKLNHVAVISHHQAPDHLAWLTEGVSTDPKLHCLSWTYKQLLSAVDQVVDALQACDVLSGTGLLTFIWNSVEYQIFFLAAIKLRMHFVPLDPRLLTRTTELESVLKPVNPGAVILLDEKAAQNFDNSSQTTRPNCKVSVILKTSASQSSPSGWLSISALTQKDYSSSSKAPPAPRSSSDVAIILFTSGTTNRPKGTPHTIENCITESYAYIIRHVRSDSRILLHNPCFRAVFYAWVICAWRQAACIILAGEKFDPSISLEAAVMHEATNMTAVPAVYTAMVEHQRFAELKPRTLEYLGFAGDVITPALLSDAKAKLGVRVVSSGLGMTECTGFIGWEEAVSDKDIPSFQGFVGVGKAGRGATIKVCEPGGRKVLKKGEFGELHLGGQGVIKEYLEGRFEELFYEDEDGRWFKTGDRVVMDQAGVVYVLGRFKDVIKRMGYAVSPIVLEGHLNSKPGIRVGTVVPAI